MTHYYFIVYILAVIGFFPSSNMVMVICMLLQSIRYFSLHGLNGRKQGCRCMLICQPLHVRHAAKDHIAIYCSSSLDLLCLEGFLYRQHRLPWDPLVSTCLCVMSWHQFCIVLFLYIQSITVSPFLSLNVVMSFGLLLKE